MKQIEKLYNEWKSLQPVPGEVQAKIDQKFMLEFNYNSNHIEGNTLTYGQTELLLMFGQVDGDAKMHDLEEMKAHNVGLKMMQEEANAAERPLTEYFIKTLHKTLIREDYTVRKELPDGNITTYTVHAGQYKTRPNSVITATGERFEYASPEETPALMTDLIDWYNGAVDEGKLSALELASLFHYRYIRIHPFEDGNGRIARLLVNFILLRAGYPMIIVRSDDKDKYLSALNRCDVTVGLNPSDGAHAELEQIQPFVNYISGCLERALTIRIRAAKGESIEEKGDWRKKLITNHTNKINQPECNKEYIEDILNNSFRPILEKIDADLSPFYSIFSKVKWYPDKIKYEKNDNEKTNGENEEYFSIITFEASPNRSLSIGLIVEFIQFKYVIKIQTQNMFHQTINVYSKEYTYSERPTESNREDIINTVGEMITDFVEQPNPFTRNRR